MATIFANNCGPIEIHYREHGSGDPLVLIGGITSVLQVWDLMLPLYIQDPTVVELEGQDRAISRAQIEFLAARTSALHDCFY